MKTTAARRKMLRSPASASGRRFGPCVDHPREPALALEMKAQRQRVQMMERLDAITATLDNKPCRRFRRAIAHGLLITRRRRMRHGAIVTAMAMFSGALHPSTAKPKKYGSHRNDSVHHQQDGRDHNAPSCPTPEAHIRHKLGIGRLLAGASLKIGLQGAANNRRNRWCRCLELCWNHRSGAWFRHTTTVGI